MACLKLLWFGGADLDPARGAHSGEGSLLGGIGSFGRHNDSRLIAEYQRFCPRGVVSIPHSSASMRGMRESLRLDVQKPTYRASNGIFDMECSSLQLNACLQLQSTTILPPFIHPEATTAFLSNAQITNRYPFASQRRALPLSRLSYFFGDTAEHRRWRSVGDAPSQ